MTWQDLKSAEKGSGTWAANSKLVNIWWKDSATRESWIRPLTPTPPLNKTWYESSYYRGNIRSKALMPRILDGGAVQISRARGDLQTGLLCWAAGSASWLAGTKRGNATVADLVKKYKERGKLDSGDALPEENVIEVFLDIGISLKIIPAADLLTVMSSKS